MSLLIPTKDHFSAQYSVCGELDDALALIKKKLTIEDLVAFRKMPFGHFLDMPPVHFSGQVIHILLLHLLREQPEDELWFSINGTIHKFKFEDFCRITGLPSTKEYPNFGKLKGSSETIHRKYLGGGSTVKCTFSYLREQYIKGDGVISGTDLVKLSSLYFVECVLLANDRGTCIDLSHLELIDDLEMFATYPWAWVSYTLTMRHLKGMMDGQPEKFKKKQKNNPKLKTFKYALYGFPLVLQIWAYETFPTLGNEIANGIRDHKCPLLRWRVEKCPQYHTLKQLLFLNDPEEEGNKLDNALDLLFRTVENLNNNLNKRIDALEEKLDGLCMDVKDVLGVQGRKRKATNVFIDDIISNHPHN